jgi:hypothetical protein
MNVSLIVNGHNIHVGVVTRLLAGEPSNRNLDSRHRQKMFISSTESVSAVGLSQRPVHWITGFFSGGKAAWA